VINVTNNGATSSYAVACEFPSGDFSKAVSLGSGDNMIEIIANNKYGTIIDRRTITLSP
jgi:hypothetical protein